jgi:FkbM family methyltransferase
MALKDIAKRLQSVDRLVPLAARVPFRYHAQRLVRGLEPEMDLLPQLVPGDKLALDVGGNRGTYAFALSKLAPEVISFEPVPDCTRLLIAWSQTTDNVRIEACGLGDREDMIAIHIPRMQGALTTTRASFSRRDGEGVDVEVPVRTLDGLALRNVGFVKIDVEGFEVAMLHGAVETLKRCQPNILIEIDAEAQPESDFTRTFEFVEQLGYQGHYLDSGKLVPCSAEVYRKVPQSMNYIFLPTASRN